MKNIEPSSRFEFKEQQWFTQWWLWTLLLIIMLTLLVGIYNQLILKVPFGNNPLSDVGLIAVSIFFFGVIVLFFSIRLNTEINTSEVKMEFFPFISKCIPWSDIKQASVINYGFVGGWGIRFGSTYGTVYNIKGRKGLAITLKTGKKFIIGTQRAEELKHFMKSIS